jgi:protoporphyrinogen oxidase
MDRPLSSIYWLNVADPEFPFGGVIEHTNLVAPERYGGRHIAYLSRYVHAGDALLTMPGDQVVERMTGALPRIYPGFRPEHVLRSHVFRTRTAATVCGIDFSRKVPRCRTPVGNMFLAGMPHVYPDERSCSNSVRVAIEACAAIGCLADAVPPGSGLAARIGFDR